ncbi:MAG: hypothetical protein U0929_09810 [Planctomycetaceae bacterium]
MARRNPAFRIAIGGLTVGVILCLVAAISLWKAPSLVRETATVSVASEAPNASEPATAPIQIAHDGEVSGLLSDPPQRPVPEPQDFVEQPALDQAPATTQRTARVAPAEPSEPEFTADAEPSPETTAAPVAAQPERTESVAPPSPSPPAVNPENGIEAEIASLKGQINELARTQLENQLAEIRHAEQLLMTHQSTRMLEALQREVDQLKAEKEAAAQLAAEAAQLEQHQETKTAQIQELPDQNSEPVVELGPMQDTSNSQDTPQADSADTHVRYSESTEMPGRYDVQADDATLQSFVAILGPVAGWNLVSGPELTGNVTLRWSRVDLRQALTQQLKAKGWQIREEGDFAIIEPVSTTKSHPITTESTPRANVADESFQAPITLKLAPGAAEGSTYDKSTGILIQPGSSARGVPVSRTRSLPAPAAHEPVQPPAYKTPTPPPASAVHEPASEPAPLLMKSTPQAPIATPAPDKVVASTPAPAPVKAPEQPSLAAPRLLPTPQPKSAPAEMTPVGATPIDLVSPSAKVDIDVTILELLSPQRPEQGLLSQSITVADGGKCPTCGLNHAAGEVPLGHATHGWFQMNEGIRCGVCTMTSEQIITRLQQDAQATITATPHAQVLSRQVAEIGLTEKQGFRRINFRTTGEKDQYELLQGGVEIALRPTLEADGVIRLDLTPVTTAAGDLTDTAKPGSPSTTSLTIPPDSCAVIGGMYFGIEQGSDLASRSKRIGSILTGKFADRDIREVVVVIHVQPAGDSDIDASPASLTIESDAAAPAPLLIPPTASPIPQ